jgi:hypothetical protein
MTKKKSACPTGEKGVVGPKGKSQFKRDNNGLLGSVDYVFHEDGTIDWRAMVKDQYLVPNRDRTSETDISKLKDSELIILLGGIKELAQIRGYTSVKYAVKCPSPDYVVTTCSVDWIPNYETEGQSITFSAIGDASPDNTKSFARFFLGPIAENRAFVRCVRNFLKINIVAQEELGESKLVSTRPTQSEKKSQGAVNPHSLLESAMLEKKVTFSNLKKRLKEESYPKIDDISSVSDIPKVKVFELIERIKKI